MRMKTMNKEEQLLKEYQKNRQKLEEQEDKIKSVQKKGQQLSEETYSEIRYLLSDIAEDSEPLENARVELSRLEDDFMMALETEKKKIRNEEEEIEQRYRKELRELEKGE